MIGAVDTVTIVSGASGDYTTTTVTGVYWYKTEGVKIQGRGFVDISSINVIFPYDTLKASGFFSGAYELKPGVHIIRGDHEVHDIRDINACAEHFVISSVADHLKGNTRIQHITVG